jgi:hypothetical protein
MLKTVDRLWPFIAISSLIAILVSVFLWPPITQPLVLILIIIGTGMAIAFAVRRRIRIYRQGRINRSEFWRSISLDVSGIFISIIAAVLLGGRLGEYLAQIVGKAVETARPGYGFVVGILTGLLAGLVVGLGVAIFVQWIFNFLTRWSLGMMTHSMHETSRH